MKPSILPVGLFLALMFSGPFSDLQAASESWDALEYGAVVSETVDSTSAVQKALDAAGEAGGGTVTLPAGRFRFDGSLSIPAGVTLEGTYRSAPNMVDLQEKPTGTVLATYAGRGSNDGTPFIQLAGNNSTVKGLAVVYPEWSPADVPPVPYPPCIAANDVLNVAILDCCLLNPYEGIRLVQAHRHLVRNVTGYPSWKGLFVDECYDIGHIENIHFWPFGVTYQPDDPYCQWINLNGTAFEFARTDWHYVANTFCFGYGIGYHFSDHGAGPTNGNFLGIGADSCRRAVLVDDAQQQGLLITNGEFVGRWSSSDSVCLEIGPDCHGIVSLTNCSFWGPIKTCIRMEATGGQLTANACHFVHWDTSSDDEAALNLVAGRAIIQGCTFGQYGTALRVGEKAGNVLATANQAPGGFRISGNETVATLTGNERSRFDLEPGLREHYQVEIGVGEDSPFLHAWNGPEKASDGQGHEVPFRWSGPESSLLLPVVPDQDYEVTLDLLVPDNALKSDGSSGIYDGDKQLVAFKSGSQSVTFPLRTGEKDLARLAVLCQTRQPSQTIPDSTDTRSLGIQLRRIVVRKTDTQQPLTPWNGIQ